jgi:DNA-binding XRE family transcriptional regulator
MKSGRFVEETELAALAKRFRQAAGKTKADAAREMGVKEPSLYCAEEKPEKSFTKLRCRMIETYSKLKVSGPFFRIEQQ